MSQESTLAKIDQAAKGRKGRFAGVFICLVGVLMLIVGPGLVIISLAPETAERDKVGAGGLITGAIGLGLAVLGWRMMFRRGKLHAQDLSETLKLEYYVATLHNRRVVSPPVLAEVAIAPAGLTVTPKEGAGQASIATINWSEVKRARWYGLFYMMEVYRISWADRELVIIPEDPAGASKFLGKFWLAFLLGGRNVSSGYAIKVGVRNMKLIQHLNPLHAYARVYAPGKASYWANYTPEKSFMEPFAFGLPIAVIACWTAVAVESRVDDNSAGFTVLTIAFVAGMLVLAVRALIELVFSRKIAAALRKHRAGDFIQDPHPSN